MSRKLREHFSVSGVISKVSERISGDVCRSLSRTTSLCSGKEKSLHRMIDIHGHYVFGVDDGAQTLEMSVDMIRQAYDQGASDIICTSHSWGNQPAYREHFAQLSNQLLTEGIPVRLHTGSEIECSEWALPHLVKQLNDGHLLPLAKSKCVLLEFFPEITGIEILSCVKQILELPACEGHAYKPVIAHVERYQCAQEDPSVIHTLKGWNVPLQINAYSLVEEPKDAIRNCARALLKDELVTFIGSDAHRTSHRPPDISSGVAYIHETCSRKYAEAVCFRNAERLLLPK